MTMKSMKLQVKYQIQISCKKEYRDNVDVKVWDHIQDKLKYRIEDQVHSQVMSRVWNVLWGMYFGLNSQPE